MASAYLPGPAHAPRPNAAPSDWVRTSASGGPGGDLSGFATAYDAADGYHVLFGGLNSMSFVLQNETMTDAGGHWSTLSLAVHPPAMWVTTMAYDPQTRSVILFGGNVQGNDLNQTWSFANGSWTNLTSSQAPPTRQGASLVYDPADGYLLMFGGSNPYIATATSYENFNDSWAFRSNAQWSQLRTNGTAPNCSLAQSVYDPSTAKVYTFSGMWYGFGSLYNDFPNVTWEYSAGTWTNITETGAPPPRNQAAFAYDPVLGAAVMYGGQNESMTGYLTDVWLLRDGHWSELQSSAPPSAQSGSSFLYDPGTHLLLLVLGVGGLYLPNSITPAEWLFDDFAPGALEISPGNGTLEPPATLSVSVNRSAALPGASYLWTGPSACTLPFGPNFTCRLTASGSYYFQANITNSYGLTVSSSGFNYTVEPSLAAPTLTLSPDSIDLTQSSSFTATASGGAPAYVYNWSGLPPGCGGATGSEISCRPTSAGQFSSIRVEVTDRLGYSHESTPAILTVFGPISLSAFRLAPSVVDLGRPILVSVSAQGGSGTYAYTWTGLPPGCPPGGAAAFTCSASVAGTYAVTVNVSDSAGLSAVASGTLTVAPLPIVSLSLSPSTLDIGQPLAITSLATGGVGGYNFTYIGLPTGCSATRAAQLRCTPSASGPYSIQVTVADAEGSTAVSNRVDLQVDPLLTLALTASASTVDRGSAVELSVAASGGTPPYSYAYSGLPPGCADQNSSVISCRPNVTGTYSVKATVTDAAGASGSNLLTLSVASPSAAGGSGALLLYAVGGAAAVAALGVVLVLRARSRRRATSDEGPDGSGDL